MPQHFIIIPSILMPMYQLFLSRICKQRVQTRNYKQVPHNLIRNSYLDLIIRLTLLDFIVDVCKSDRHVNLCTPLRFTGYNN
jgi:hypothetical protein